VSDRISEVAPFLAFDSDPYLVINSAGGLDYIQDAYTTSDRFPNAQAFNPGDLRPVTAWLRAGVYHEFLGRSRMNVSSADGPVGFISDLGGTWAGFNTGVSAQLRRNLSLFANANYHTDFSSTREAYGGRIGVMWSDHDGLPAPATTSNGYYFASIAAGDDPTAGGSWTLDPKVTNLVADGEQADNHLNVKVASDGTIYAVGKTNKDTINCATNTSLPLIELFKRTTGGVWTAHLVSTVGDCQTRPQVLIDEELDTAYVLLTGPNGGGTAYMKSAPLSGPDALKFRGPAGLIQVGMFIGDFLQ
jgi:hypothetical protein